MKEKYYLYWIHRSCHINISTEGYIGITNDYKSRFRVHRYNAKLKNSYHIHHALNRYSDIIFDIICIGTMNDILHLEFELRPKINIGWNILKGGKKPRTGMKDSPKTIQKKSESLTVLTRCDHLKIYGLKYIKGYSFIKIAKQFNCTPQTIGYVFSSNNKSYPDLDVYKNRIKAKRVPSAFSCKGISEFVYNKIMDDYEAGVLIKHIAIKYNRPRCTIRTIYQAKSKYIKAFKERRIHESRV